MRSAPFLFIAALSLGACTNPPPATEQCRITAIHEAGHATAVRAHKAAFTFNGSTISDTCVGNTSYEFIPDGTEARQRILVRIMLAGSVSERGFQNRTYEGNEPDEIQAMEEAKKIAAKHPGERAEDIINEERENTRVTLLNNKSQLTRVANILWTTGQYK